MFQEVHTLSKLRTKEDKKVNVSLLDPKHLVSKDVSTEKSLN